MMEYFWYILASVLAGVGTGLVGLLLSLFSDREMLGEDYLICI